MNEYQHAVLCVDDEENILHSLRRLLRKEGYRLLTASSGVQGLEIFKENDIHLVMCDQRMPEMSGTEFLARVKAEHPDVIRIILTGYTDVDSITESINKGHIYKFFLKPWNDQNLKLEIRQGLGQYELIQTNKKLHKKIMDQNCELKRINESLETKVRERTQELEIQNQALELSQAMLENLAVPIIGVSAEGMIVMLNKEAKGLSHDYGEIEIGNNISDYFSDEIADMVHSTLETNKMQILEEYRFPEETYRVRCTPLSGRFEGRGVVLSLRPVDD